MSPLHLNKTGTFSGDTLQGAVEDLWAGAKEVAEEAREVGEVGREYAEVGWEYANPWNWFRRRQVQNGLLYQSYTGDTPHIPEYFFFLVGLSPVQFFKA